VSPRRLLPLLLLLTPHVACSPNRLLLAVPHQDRLLLLRLLLPTPR
jgi:hypothetical protein